MSFSIEQNNIILKHQNKLPVPVIKLANSFNIDVYRDIKMDKDISGAIINENGIYSIYVNGREPEYRRRFTIAHEIAHFLLHREMIEKEFNGNLTDTKGSNGIMYRSKLYTMFEVELPHCSTIFHSIDTARYYVGLYGFHIRLNCVLT